LRIRFVYTALKVKDLNRSVRFYSKAVRMKIVVRKQVKETNGELCLMRSGRNYLELNSYSGSKARRGSNLDHLAFEVSPFTALPRMVSQFKTKGIRIEEYLETAKWGRFFVADPDGNWLEIFARKPPTDSRSASSAD